MTDIDKMLRQAAGQKVSSRERVPTDTKNNVRKRARNTCEYPRCKEKEFLEFHHIDMRNNNNRLSNIELLCPKHHRKRHSEKIRKVVGKDWITGEKKTRLVRKPVKKSKKKTTKKKTESRKKKTDQFGFPVVKMPKPPKFKF